MNEIEKKALEIFQKNMKYFSKEHKNLYKKLYLFNEAIENESYNEKYSLEYMDDNYFDILELSSGEYFYNMDTNSYDDNIVSNINYKKNDSVIQGYYTDNINDNQLKKVNSEVNLNTRLFSAGNIIHHYNIATRHKNEMKKIYKYIFIGVGLGLHIIKVQKKIKALQLYIIENNIELFRLSLFVTDYKILSETSKLSFSIMDTDDEFKINCSKFLENLSTHNHYLKYCLLDQDNIYDINRLQSVIVAQNYLIHPYSKMLKGYIKGPEYIIDNYPFISMSKNLKLNSPLKNKPVLIIGSGPSLGHNIQWLKNNYDKFYIISALSSISILQSINIVPDITIHIDPDPISLKIISDIDMNIFLNKTLFLFSSLVTNNVVQCIPKEQLFFMETSVKYKKNNKFLSLPSVGETSYAVGLLLGAKNLYLLGLDLALDPETRSTHSTGHVFKRKVDDNDDGFILNNTIIETKGNFIDIVSTTSIYKISILACILVSRNIKSTQNVYNLNNGAFIEGTIPLKTKDINTRLFSKINNSTRYTILYDFLKEVSEYGMNKDDIKNISSQLSEAKRLYKLVSIYKETKTEYNFNSYLMKFYNLYQELLNFNENSKYDINKVMNSYISYISGYIFDILNTKNIVNEEIEIKKMDNMLIDGINRILKLYITSMQVYITWLEDKR